MIISVIKKGRRTIQATNFIVDSVEKTLKLQERLWEGKVMAHRLLSDEEISIVKNGTAIKF